MPSFSQTQWTSCKRCSLEWAAPTGTQPCTVFSYKDFCGSTVLGTPESVAMNGQIDWQAQQISHLVCSLAGQRCSEAWGTFSTQTSQNITALTAWRKEEWRKEAADIPPSKVDNDLCSTRQILVLFRGQPWGDCWETGRSAYGPFRALRCHLELKLKLKLPLQDVALRQSPPSSCILCCPCPYHALLSHNVISPMFWSFNCSYTLYLPVGASNSPSVIFHFGNMSSPFPF